MSNPTKQVVVTGAAGFIGSRIVDRLLADPSFVDARITISDMKLSPRDDERVRVVEGDFCDPSVRSEMLQDKVDLLFHLGGIMGGTAEMDYPLARSVNVDATLSLFEALRSEAAPPRVVFASSIAVFGPPLPSLIDDDTHPVATMYYGAQKRMMEVVLEQFSARGLIDGLAIRLPGIVARPGVDPRFKSAFMSAVFHAYAAGEDFVMPCSPGGRLWLISVPACVDAFLHAAAIPAKLLGQRRAFTLPAQVLTVAELIAALAARFPESGSVIRYEPDPALEAVFTSQPPLSTALADSLGFKHDGDLPTLINRALSA